MKIEDSQGVISIKTDGFISCLSIKNPLALDWLAVTGSIERYYTCLPFVENVREIVENIVGQVQRLSSVEEFIETGFLSLLEDGEYELKIRSDIKGCKLIFNSSLYNTNYFVKQNEEINEFNENEKTRKITKLYRPEKNALTFTRPIESLDQGRITYYENKIRIGEKPKPILLRNKILYKKELFDKEFNDYSANYILDGHHKLVAYHNLGIPPNFIQIDSVKNYDLRVFDYDILHRVKKDLYTCQFTHIISNGFRVDFSEHKLYENEIDEYLYRANILDEILLINMSDMARSPSFFGRKEWALERIEVLKKRLAQPKNNLYLEYFDGSTGMRKRTMIDCWEKIESFMKMK